MMYRRVPFLALWLTIASAGNNYTNPLWEHRCDAGSEVFACSIPDFLYLPGQNSSRVIETDPAATRRVVIRGRLRWRSYGMQDDNILAYDSALHNELKRPRAVQISRSMMKKVEIPIDLEYGEFSLSSVSHVIVPPAGTVYPLRYLDLSYNNLQDIFNLSSLVKLETLDLTRNRISSINGEVLKRLVNLTVLVISKNRIMHMPYDRLPPKLTHLYAQMNELHTLDLSGVNLPALEVFSIAFNFLTELDVPGMLAATPKLKEIHLSNNEFGHHLERNVSAALKLHGIAHDEGFGEEEKSPFDYSSLHNGGTGNDDDDDDDSFYRDRKAQFWEHTVSWLVGIGNVCVVAAAAVAFYKSKRAEAN